MLAGNTMDKPDFQHPQVQNGNIWNSTLGLEEEQQMGSRWWIEPSLFREFFSPRMPTDVTGPWPGPKKGIALSNSMGEMIMFFADLC